MIQVFRLVRAELKGTMWTGEGGLQVDGRWHTPGKRIVYTAQSLSLAQLEVLVHISDRRQLPALVYSIAEIPDSLKIDVIDWARLPVDWRQFAPYSAATQRLGMMWLDARSSAVLRVPSAISESEWNFLLNPGHVDFEKLKMNPPKDFAMNPRVP